MAKPRFLWEIMVPCYWNSGRPVRTRHHQEWDKVVRKIAGGLTIYKPALGQWVDDHTKDLYAERVIPVRIACTENQIKQIAQFSLKHYNQLAIMVYVVSETVLIFKANEQERQNQATDAVHECGRTDRSSIQGESSESSP